MNPDSRIGIAEIVVFQLCVRIPIEHAYRKSTREKQDTSCSVLVEMSNGLLPNKIQWRVCRKKRRSHGDIDGIGQNTVRVAQ